MSPLLMPKADVRYGVCALDSHRQWKPLLRNFAEVRWAGSPLSSRQAFAAVPVSRGLRWLAERNRASETTRKPTQLASALDGQRHRRVVPVAMVWAHVVIDMAAQEWSRRCYRTSEVERLVRGGEDASSLSSSS